MPVQSNIGILSQGVVAWDGLAAYEHDIRKHTVFGWCFEVVTDIATDAVFNIETAPADAADPCVPGAWEAVPEVSICSDAGVPGPQATVTIPAGTTAGTICAGTIPCKGKGFVRLADASGDTANIRAVLIRHGAKM